MKEGQFGWTIKVEQIPYKSAHIIKLTPGENTELRGDTVVAACHGGSKQWPVY